MDSMDSSEYAPYLNLARAMIIDTLYASVDPRMHIRKDAYRFIQTDLFELICEAIKLPEDDVRDMMGNKKQIRRHMA